jgi:predicted nucleotidyltransferase
METHVVKIRNSLPAIASKIFSEHRVLFAYLYGSYATGIVHPFSDLDIGVYIKNLRDNKHLELELPLSLEFDNLLKPKATSEGRNPNYK